LFLLLCEKRLPLYLYNARLFAVLWRYGGEAEASPPIPYFAYRLRFISSRKRAIASRFVNP
jgi:hypothetical protein